MESVIDDIQLIEKFLSTIQLLKSKLIFAKNSQKLTKKIAAIFYCFGKKLIYIYIYIYKSRSIAIYEILCNNRVRTH